MTDILLLALKVATSRKKEAEPSGEQYPEIFLHAM